MIDRLALKAMAPAMWAVLFAIQAFGMFGLAAKALKAGEYGWVIAASTMAGVPIGIIISILIDRGGQSRI